MFGMLASAMFAFAPVAEAQLAKQGQPRGSAGFYGKGTTQDFGNEVGGWTGEFWGTSFNDQGKGFFHEVSWYCNGTFNSAKGIAAQLGGICKLADRDGDLIYLRWEPVEYLPMGNAKNKGTYLSGTGKYKGIQGYYILEGKYIADGNWAAFLTGGEYKLP